MLSWNFTTMTSNNQSFISHITLYYETVYTHILSSCEQALLYLCDVPSYARLTFNQLTFNNINRQQYEIQY